MKDSILLTKLQQPQIKKKTVRRNRLLKLLKEKLDRKLILINAGAGYGKTTLLSQLLAEIDIPYLFYHLEKTDAEIDVFLSYLIAGIKKRSPKFGKRTESILQTLKYPNKHLDIIVGTFINEVVEEIFHDLIIVLDDYHTVDPSTQIDSVLNYLFSHAPPSLHLIISTRQTPNFYLSQMKAQRNVFELTSEDLKFTSEETKELLEDIHSISLKENEIKTLQRYCEGWITSLQLMLQSSAENIRKPVSIQYSLPDLKNQYRLRADYFNYFAQEIYNREEENIKQFMVDCSILEWLNPDICYAVTDQRTSESTLRDLETRNAFLYRVSGNNYRFHNLFRDFLSSKLRDSRRKKICLKAAHYFSSVRQTEYVASYYLQAGQFNKVVNIVSKVGYDLTDRGKSDTVCSYIERLPTSIINQHPDILMVYGYALMLNGYPNEATDNLIKAAKLFQKKSKSSTKLARTYFELASVNFLSGNDRLAMKWLSKALRACPKKKDLTYVHILNSLGILFSRMGVTKFGDAIDSFRKALQIIKKLPKDEGLEAVIYNNWAMTERKAGNLRAAYEKSISAIRLLKKEGNFCAQSGTTFCNAAWFSLQLGDIKRAHTILKLGIDISKKYNDIYSLATLWKGFSWYYIETGDSHRAKEYLQKSIEFIQERQFKTALQTANRDLCLINIELGLLSEAEHNLSASWEIKKTRDDADAIELLVAEARLRRAQGKLDRAEKTFLYALRLAKKYGQIYETFIILLELADVLYNKKMIVQAEEILSQAITLSKEKGYDYRFAIMMKKKKPMIKLLVKIEKKYILSVLNRAHIPYHIIELSLFGDPKASVDGKEIRSESWKTLRAMKLFSYLCVKREKPASRDVLIDALWRDASLRSGSINLRKAMQHIRQAFKATINTDDNPLLYRCKLYSISPHFSVWTDVDEFMHPIDTMIKSKRFSVQHKDSIIKAVNLYEDGFAKGWYDEWIEEMRSYYGKMYEECCLMIAEYYFKKSNYKESIIWFKKLIVKNFYEEEYHKKLWTAYAKTRKYNSIKQDFTALGKAFKKEMKAKLQQSTIALYNSLIK